MTMRHAIKSALVVGAVLALFGGGKATGRAATSGLLATDVPASVMSGEAVRVGRHDATAMLRLNVGLAVRDQAGLDKAWRAMTTVGSPSFGIHLTQAQYQERYAPTEASVRAARSWLEERGLTVTGVSPDNLLVHVQAPARVVEQAFGVKINDYRLGKRTLYANDRGPTVPPPLGVRWISGLSNANVYRTNFKAGAGKAAASLKPNVLRKAYNVTKSGSGLTIGFTVWGRPLPQSDFDEYAQETGTTKIVVNKSGDDGLEWKQIDGMYSNSDKDAEVALDAEIAHGVAPGSHLVFFLGGNSSDSTMEDVLDQAANAGLDVVSNSWVCDTKLGCNPDRNMDSILQMGTVKGTNWFFGSGDNGAGGESYPASSPYVVAVGGTVLSADANGNYQDDTVWSLAGAGCSLVEPWPQWQDQNAASCFHHRSFPDVSANAGAPVYVYQDGDQIATGTSVATPIWAGIVTTWNRNNILVARPKVPFLPPLLYSLAEGYHAWADFHDTIFGWNGLDPETGFDMASGWGSVDVAKLANNPVLLVYSGPTSGDDGDTITLSASLYEKPLPGDNMVVPLAGRELTLIAATEGCQAVTDSNGDASCNVTLHGNFEPPGKYNGITFFSGDAAWVGAVSSEPFIVNGIPTKLEYTGQPSVPYTDTALLSATLTDASAPSTPSSGEPIPGMTVEFTVGAENCSGVTDIDGVASCYVTVDGPPGSSYGIVALFSGDSPAYLASGDAAHTLKVTKEAGVLSYTGPAVGDYHDPFVATALFRDPDSGDPIIGRTIYYQLGATDTCNGTTGLDGTASCLITPTQAPDSYLLKASFNGDEFYETSSDSRTFTVTKEESSTVFSPPPPLKVAIGADLKLSAHLTEDASSPLAGRTLTFTIGSKPNTQSCKSALTDASGNAGCTIANVQQPASGQYLFAKFTGDAFYEASQGKATITVLSPSRTLRRG